MFVRVWVCYVRYVRTCRLIQQREAEQLARCQLQWEVIWAEGRVQRGGSSTSKIFSGMWKMLQLYCVVEPNTLMDHMRVCICVWWLKERWSSVTNSWESYCIPVCMWLCVCICVSPLDDFCNLGLPVSNTLLLVGQLSHLVLQLPVGASHLLKHAWQLGEGICIS